MWWAALSLFVHCMSRHIWTEGHKNAPNPPSTWIKITCFCIKKNNRFFFVAKSLFEKMSVSDTNLEYAIPLKQSCKCKVYFSSYDIIQSVSPIHRFTDSDLGIEMIHRFRSGRWLFASLLWPLFIRNVFFRGSWGNSEIGLKLKIEPTLANLACLNRWNTLYWKIWFKTQEA